METNHNMSNEESLKMEQFEIEERANRIDEIYVAHTSAHRAVAGIEDCLRRSLTAAEPLNAVLIGRAGTGKTTVCNAVLQHLPRRIDVREGKEVTVIPAFYSEIPSPATIRGVASSLLGALGDVHPDRGTAINLTHRVITQLKACETRLILLDEFQHLLDEKRSRREEYRQDVSNWVKTLINKTHVPVVLVGMPECEVLVDADPQLARRFQRRFRLENLGFGGKEKGEFRLFVEALGAAIPEYCNLAGFPDLSSKTEALALYAASGGNPSYATGLLKETVIVTLRARRETTTMEDFAAAYDIGVSQGGSLVKVNPFRLSQEDLVRNIKNGFRGVN